MNINENIVRTIIEDVNKTVFAGEFPIELIDVDVDFLDTEWGFCVDEDDRIVIGLTNEFRSRKQLIEIVTHEMIHAMQIYNDVVVSHDSQFWDMYVEAAAQAGIKVKVTD